jgi:succinate dehydrogenase/fumarate reductase flavoprotein subunit
MMIYPAIHYTMGGLWVDYDLMSTVSGLFVLGEANFSDHGANRLGASALMQGQAAADVGQKMDAVPVFDSVSAARAATGADCSMSFVPPAFATDAILEAVIRQNGRWAALGG